MATTRSTAKQEGDGEGEGEYLNIPLIEIKDTFSYHDAFRLG